MISKITGAIIGLALSLSAAIGALWLLIFTIRSFLNWI